MVFASCRLLSVPIAVQPIRNPFLRNSMRCPICLIPKLLNELPSGFLFLLRGVNHDFPPKHMKHKKKCAQIQIPVLS